MVSNKRVTPETPIAPPRPFQALALLAMAAILAIPMVGCEPNRISMGPQASAKQYLTVETLATQLGLRLGRSGQYAADLSDSVNALVLLGPPRPAVILNGQRVDGADEVSRVGGRLAVSIALARRIGALLRRPPRRRTNEPPDLARPVTGTVVLDPGHGGKDPGASNKFGPCEKIIALDTAIRVRNILSRKNISTVLTRDRDTFISLEQRADMANRAGADLFVSIHADAAPRRGARGFTVYVARKSSRASLAMGRRLVRAMRSPAEISRGLKRRDFRVLVLTDMPAALIELGYLTNPTDGRSLATAAYRQNLAEAIAGAIVAQLARS